MIRKLEMRRLNIDFRHVAGSAIRILGMVPVPEAFAMARQAFGSIIGDAQFCTRRIVGIMTSCAGHGVPHFLPTSALHQSLKMAYRPRVGRTGFL